MSEMQPLPQLWGRILKHFAVMSLLTSALTRGLSVAGQHVVTSYDETDLRLLLVSNDNETVIAGSRVAVYSLNASSLQLIDQVPIPYGPTSILIQNTIHDNGDVFTCGNASTYCHTRQLSNISIVSKKYLIGNGTDGSVGLFIENYSGVLLLFVSPYFQSASDPGLQWFNLGGGQQEEQRFNRDSTFKSVKYVDAFQVEHYAYVFSIWKTNNGSLQTRVALQNLKMREKEKYIDMRIGCGSYSVLQDIAVSGSGPSAVITAVFTSADKRRSAICFYRISDVKQRFTENIINCHLNNSVPRPSDESFYFKNGDSCARLPEQDGAVISSLFSGNLHQNMENMFRRIPNIIGTKPLNHEPSIKKAAYIRSLATQYFGSKVFAFFGTQHGNIYKTQVHPSPGDPPLLWSSLSSPVLDIQSSADQRRIYALTDSQVVMLEVEACSKYTSCEECTTVSKDPMCGWCMLENRCTWLEGCSSKSLVNTCPVVSVSPSFISMHSQEMVMNLTLSNEVENVSLRCDWTLPGERTQPLGQEATRINDTYFQCPFANLSSYHSRARGVQNILIVLVGPLSDKPIMQGTVVYINCERINSCTSCLDEAWSGTCSWRGYTNTCFFTDHPTQSQYGSELHQMSECPVVQGYVAPNIMDSNGTLHIASHLDSQISIHGSSFLEPKDNVMYRCGLDTQDMALATYVNESTVTCTIKKPSQNRRYNTTVELRWGTSVVASTASQVIEVYSCASVVSEDNMCQCASFKYYKPYYQCDICGNQCLGTSESCDQPRKCPPPRITSVYPLSSHINSSVTITMTGTNLGSNFNDTRNSVTIAEVPCEGSEEGFIASQRLVCRLPPSNRKHDGAIKVEVTNQPTVTFGKEFSFRVPVVTKIVPSIGPRSGGTRLTISGKYLNTGIDRQVSLGGRSCVVMEMNETITCKTAASGLVTPQNISVSFDGSTVTGDDVHYTYVEDPRITSIFPNSSFNSGGRLVKVYGVRLYAIQQPKIFLHFFSGISRPETCEPTTNETAEFIRCPTPCYNTTRRAKRELPHKHTARVGFVMDDVATVQDLPALLSSLVYYPDPQIYKLDNEKTDFQPVLVIKGKGLTTAANKEDIEVKIGRYSSTSKSCYVTTLEADRIVCNPPEDPPDETESDSEYPIKVKIGYINKYVGYIVYEKPTTYVPYLVSVVILVIIIIVIVAVVLLVRRRYGLRLRSQQEKMEHKMDKLESAFRMKCREEFAELQTAMCDLTKDLEGGHVLFRDYVTYTSHAMLAWEKDHPILAPPAVMTDTVAQAMEQFRALLTKSPFLLMIIRTFEKQSNFSIKDRSEVALLLMVIHHDNMEYLTSILLTLLNDLVDKNIAAQTPKLVMRRSESVVEKLLTNWLSVCMYHGLKEKSGSSLYILYKAIKIQVEKGPLDYITNCAKYSLSEDKLYIPSEQDGQIQPITLEVDHIMFTDNQKHHSAVKVLDCDTVTQAKNKILDIFYNNIPYSRRPTVHSTALEELEADGTSRLFNDEDASSEKDGLWKRLNTLRHYKVKDGAKVRLVISKLDESLGTPSGLPAAGTGSPDAYIGSMRKSKRIVRTVSGSNFWHLTRQIQTNEEVKLSSDVFLPRMLSTKGTLQTYVDDLFKEVLVVEEGAPLIVKFLFDFLDAAAARCGITDPDVLHTWKCNSMLLRFWVNIIKNPEFVFDIHKPIIVDSCLSVITQTLMDSCSTAVLNLGPHSPSNKLLYAKDIPRYKAMVSEFFKNVQDQPSVSDQDFNSFLTEMVSGKFSSGFNRTSALLEMFKYIKKFNKEIMAAMDNLEAEAPGSYLQLSSKLQTILYSMDVN